VAVARDVYVSQTGSDVNPGTREKPLATVEKAVETMRGAGAGTIWIGPGEYYLKQGLALDAKHGGTSEQPLVIRSPEPGKTRLSGARTVDEFRAISDDEAKPLISAEAKQHVVVADLKSRGFPPLAQMPAHYRAHSCEEVVFDDLPMQSARWPNEGFTEFTEVIDSGASAITHWDIRTVYRPGAFRFPGDRPKQWDFGRGVWLHGFWCYKYWDSTLKAATYNPDGGELRFAAKDEFGIGSPRAWDKKAKYRFYALNVFEELDRPGEYYLDRQNNRLFFWPPGDLKKTPVRLTLCAKPLLRVKGVANLVIRDLIFENGRGTGVVISESQHCRIEGCLIRNMGQMGIDLNGSHLAVLRCEITQTAAGGIGVCGGDRKTLTPGACSVVSCHIHHIGRLDWDGGRAVFLNGCGNRVANNLIHDGPSGAIRYSGNEHLIELNEIHTMCSLYEDVGVIYTGRDWASQGNVVRWNYIHDISSKDAQALYLDDCDSGDTLIGNIVFNGGKHAVMLGGGRDNTFRGNVFINMPIGIHVDARGLSAIVFNREDSWNLLAKCERLDYLSPLWKQRYPRLAKTMSEDPLLPLGNVLHENILIGCKKPFELQGGTDRKWLDRVNNPQWELKDFPGLIVDGTPAKLVLSKLPEVWRKVAGFEPIPIEKIGLPPGSN
jgi:hypothetical protein